MPGHIMPGHVMTTVLGLSPELARQLTGVLAEPPNNTTEIVPYTHTHIGVLSLELHTTTKIIINKQLTTMHCIRLIWQSHEATSLLERASQDTLGQLKMSPIHHRCPISMGQEHYCLLL